jgi:tripartite-type tricarboxylate transporter receptor subunit TctC
MKKILLIVVGMFFSPSLIDAAEYPTKPIEVIVNFAAGGGTDLGARMLAKIAKKYMPQPLVILNKPGAGGEIGWIALAKAKPDGYTIGFIQPPTIVLLPYQRKVDYKMSDFEYIINIMEDIGCLTVRSDSKYKNLKELIKDAKRKPGELTVGNAGTGTDSHMTIIDFSQKARISINPVPFKGGSDSRSALLGGHVDAVLMKVGEAKPFVQSNQIRILAVADRERVKDFPEIPTFMEEGVNTEMKATRALAGPVGIPEYAVKYLHDHLKKTMEDPEFIELTLKAGIYVKYMTAQEFKKLIDSVDETYGPMWKDIEKK